MKIKDYLTKKKINQTEFAKSIGLSPAVVSLWISGKKIPSPCSARKIVKHTKGQVSYADLYASGE